MKVQRSSGTAKKVFVNIRDVRKQSPISRLPTSSTQTRGILVPKPPEPQPQPQFIRKKIESFRCHTPDQGGGKPQYSQALPPLSQKKIVSSVINSPNSSNPPIQRNSSTYLKSKESELKSYTNKSPIERDYYKPIGPEKITHHPVNSVTQSTFFKGKENEKLNPQPPTNNRSPIDSDHSPFLRHRESDRQRRSPIETDQSTYFKPKEIDTHIMFPKSPIEREDSICMPYELKEKPKVTIKNVEIRRSVKNLTVEKQRVDLRKGSFSKKQISTLTSADTSINQSRMDLDISKISLKCDDIIQPWEDISTNHPSRNPSPDLSTSRHNRFQQLSKGFKLDKQSFVSQIDKQARRTRSENNSTEKTKGVQAFTPEPPLLHPWQKFMQDLDDISHIADISMIETKNETKFVKPKGPIKARHL